MATTTKLQLIALAMAVAAHPVHGQALPPAGQSQPNGPVSERGPLPNIPISSGDMLDVEVFDTPELSGKIRVDQEGKVTLPVGGDVKVQGLQANEAAAAIRAHLIGAKIMLDPVVTVSILEYSTEGVTVLGEVKAPGIYTLLGPRSLYDALASAGGPTTSEGATITITHANDASHPVTIDVPGPNYSPEEKAAVVLPGDTVVVNRAPLVYVVGDVGHSGAFYIQVGSKLNLLNLIALSGGPNKTAAMSKSAIVRPMPDGSAQTIRFDMDRVMKNEDPNLVLQAGDVVVVPRSAWKNFETIILPTLTNSVTTAAVYNALGY